MQEQFLFYGIVEDNNDPLKLWRCRVRIFGIHTENITEADADSYIPVEDLPWVDVLLAGSGMDGEGQFVPIAKGTTVIVSFLDPEKQRPIVIGSLPRIVAELPDFESGFSDPDGVHPDSNNLGESTISRLARNEEIDETIIQTKINDVKTGVDCNGETWDEPITQYATTYPNNRVIQTKKHIFEMDDSDGVERIHIYHNSGSSKEFHPNGDEVNITKGKKFTIVISDDDILIEGNSNVRIQGNQNIFIIGNENKKIGENQNIDIVGNVNKTVGEDQNIDIVGTENINIGEDQNIDIVENVYKTVGGNQIVDITGNENKSMSNQTIIIDGTQNIQAGTSITLKSPYIYLDGVVSVLNNLQILNSKTTTFTGNVILEKMMWGQGNISLTGNINCNGNMNAGGNMLDGGSNTNHHTH